MHRLLPLLFALLAVPASAQVINVATGSELLIAAEFSDAGSELRLTSADPYEIDRPLRNTNAITIFGDPELESAPEIRATGSAFGDPLVRPGASLRLEYLALDGAGLAEEVIRIKDAGLDSLFVTDVTLRGSEDGEDLVRINDEDDGSGDPLVLGAAVFEDVVFAASGRGAFRTEATIGMLSFEDITAFDAEEFRLDGAVDSLHFDGATLYRLNGGGAPAIDVRSEDYGSVEIRDALIQYEEGGAIDLLAEIGAENIVIENTYLVTIGGMPNAFPGEDNPAEAAFDAGEGNGTVVSGQPIFENPITGVFNVDIAVIPLIDGDEEGTIIGDNRWGLFSEDESYTLGADGPELSAVVNQLASVPSSANPFAVLLDREADYALRNTLRNRIPLRIEAEGVEPGQEEPALARVAPGADFEDGEKLFRPEADLELVGVEADGEERVEEVLRYDEGTGASITVRSSILANSGEDEDLVRFDQAVGAVFFDDVILRNAGRRPVAFRGDFASPSFVMTNSTIDGSRDRLRLEAAPDTFAMEFVTITGIDGAATIDFQPAFPAASLRNVLFWGNTNPIDVDSEETNLSINFSDFEDADDLNSRARRAFDAGEGNFSADPVYENPDEDDYSVLVTTEAATGASDGGPVGDPRWGTYMVVSNEDETAAPTFALGLYPNPLAGDATVRFSLAEAGTATLRVYDMLGRVVATLAEGEYAAGRHEATWTAGDVASGVYLLRLSAGRRSATERVTVLR
ncbi:MAG: T9SS type A sorting domain-containing protein [Bacteroidota bacterium]